MLQPPQEKFPVLGVVLLPGALLQYPDQGQRECFSHFFMIFVLAVFLPITIFLVNWNADFSFCAKLLAELFY